MDELNECLVDIDKMAVIAKRKDGKIVDPGAQHD